MFYDIEEEGENVFEIDGLKFELTCYACPEQYDVTKDGKQVGYVRLRWGNLRVDFPDCGGETIYRYGFDDGLQGSFNSQEERKFYLKEIAKAINKKLDLNFCAE